ncbi:hypothetical protein GCM10022255_101990 [Dactylosporangium darangshiense]|uniref:Uncharacterized protein n=1 Tax=Dactylosporangium darangshiense TaxID=579108 RepID=A0ABP8DSL5_9ACTN
MPVPRRGEFGGPDRTAEHCVSLEYHDIPTGTAEHRRRDQPVDPAANDDRVADPHDGKLPTDG